LVISIRIKGNKFSQEIAETYYASEYAKNGEESVEIERHTILYEEVKEEREYSQVSQKCP